MRVRPNETGYPRQDARLVPVATPVVVMAVTVIMTVIMTVIVVVVVVVVVVHADRIAHATKHASVKTFPHINSNEKCVDANLPQQPVNRVNEFRFQLAAVNATWVLRCHSCHLTT